MDPATLVIVGLVIVTALTFDFTNGFHDTANAMATSIATGALKPKTAVIAAGTLNLVGAFLSVEVAKTISGGLINEQVVTIAPEFILAGLIGAIIWNLLTWLVGLPSSSSHALFGGLVGALIAAIPAVLRIRWDINEVVSSLMINYIVVYFGTWLLRNFMLDPQAGFNASKAYEKSATLPVIIPGTRIHVGLILSVAVVVFSYLFLKKTKWGYQIRMMGYNSSFAVYSGMGVTGILLLSQMLGGFIAGLGGATEVLGLYTRFEWAAAPSTGFDGIMVAAIAQRNPAMVPLAALFLAYIRVGADVISRTSDVPAEIVSIIQALIIMLVGAQMFLSGLRHKQIVKASSRQLAKEGN